MKKLLLSIVLIFGMCGFLRSAVISTNTMMDVIKWIGECDTSIDTMLGVKSDTDTVKGKIEEVRKIVAALVDSEPLIDLAGASYTAGLLADAGNIGVVFARDLIRALDTHIRLRRDTTNYVGLDTRLNYFSLKVTSDFKDISDYSGVFISTWNVQ